VDWIHLSQDRAHHGVDRIQLPTAVWTGFTCLSTEPTAG
jgi:hypothetical protein